ncbi:helix-turn-helix domain-containing protein [Phytoactinopolyspora halotolerans]|uniref:Helix-turn-helix domain-containing protein n=2 Tax=Phytoactinopolyspora halotolerans TaxID=1981512 RepID=A0A6L9SD64_9ACTN|nr:helix-turn-helix domain-containing protein [Phytoactinopolyspora halotolerans]
MPDVQLGYVELGGDVYLTYRIPDDRHVIHAPLSGVAEVTLGPEQYSLARNRAVVFGPAARPSMRVNAGCRMLVLQIRQAALEVMLSKRVKDGIVATPLQFERLMDFRGHAGSWFRGWLFMVQELDTPGSLLEDPRHARRSELLIMDTLLDVQPHNYARALDERFEATAGQAWADPRWATFPRYLREAVEIIERNPEEDHKTKTLAARVSISPRMLQIAFKDYLGTTPGRFHRDVRLERVREALLEASAGSVTVDRIARSFGFNHYGYFGGVYREKYGESPRIALRTSPEPTSIPHQRSGTADRDDERTRRR